MPAGFDNRKAHLVCGHSDEAADAPVYAAGFQKHVCAKGVIHGESQAVAKGVVYMCLHEQCISVQHRVSICLHGNAIESGFYVCLAG